MVKQNLLDNGWEKPLDESPFELPDGWSGGGVVHTGGNIWCRVWKREEDNIEVIYNMSSPGVGVQEKKEDGSYDIKEEFVSSEMGDEARWNAAKGYIENY